MGAPFPWFGGKSLLARRIADMIPPHRVYVEVFAGSAAVLFAKGRSHLEVWNDVDDGLVTFFGVLRDQPAELVEALRLTPFSRAEHRRCWRTWREAPTELERARRWFVALSQAFNAAGPSGGGGTGWSGEYAGASNLPAARAWPRSIEQLAAAAERFAGVQIEALDWRAALERYDGPDAAFYLDPPYSKTVRRSGGYAHELAEHDHLELVQRVAALEAPVVLVSHYDHEAYAELERAGFEAHRFRAVTRASLSNGRAPDAGERVEVVWRRAPGTLF